MKVNFVSLQMKRHAQHAGYSQLTNYLKGRKMSPKKYKLPSFLLPYLLDNLFLKRTGLTYYNPDSLLTEFTVIRQMLIKKKEIFHFIYGENSYYYSSFFSKLRGHKIIATFHFPPSVFPKKVRHLKHIRKLDALIVVAKNQISFFAKILPRKKIFFIPHGIDTKFFHLPKPSLKEDNICLFVGHFQRDFKTLNEVIHLVSQKDKSIKFIVVTWKEDFSKIKKNKNLILKTRISDSELLKLYQKATLLFQPMKNCTANNVILEGLSCGLPVIASDVGGVRDYLNPSCAVLTPPHDPKRMAKELIRLINNQPRLKKMSQHSHRQAKKFSWPKIALKTKKVYQKVSES